MQRRPGSPPTAKTRPNGPRQSPTSGNCPRLHGYRERCAIAQTRRKRSHGTGTHPHRQRRTRLPRPIRGSFILLSDSTRGGAHEGCAPVSLYPGLTCLGPLAHVFLPLVAEYHRHRHRHNLATPTPTPTPTTHGPPENGDPTPIGRRLTGARPQNIGTAPLGPSSDHVTPGPISPPIFPGRAKSSARALPDRAAPRPPAFRRRSRFPSQTTDHASVRRRRHCS